MPTSQASAHLAHCRPGRRDFHMGKLREFVSPQAALPSERAPLAPLDNLTSCPLDPNPAPSRLSHTKPGLAHKHAWVTRRFILNPSPSPPTPSSQHLQTNSLLVPTVCRSSYLTPATVQSRQTPPIRAPIPSVPSSTNVTLLLPCPRPQTNSRPAGHPSCLPPVVLPTRPCPCLHAAAKPAAIATAAPFNIHRAPLPSRWQRQQGFRTDLSASPYYPLLFFSRCSHMALLRAEIYHAHTHAQCRLVGSWSASGSRTGATARELCTTPKIGCCTRGTGCWVRGTVPLVAPWPSRALFCLFPATCAAHPTQYGRQLAMV